MQEQTTNGYRSFVRRPMKSSISCIVNGIWIGTSFDKEGDQICMAILRSNEEGCTIGCIKCIDDIIRIVRIAVEVAVVVVVVAVLCIIIGTICFHK